MILRKKSSPTCREVVFLIFHVIAVILIRRCTTVWIHDRFKLKYVCTCIFSLTCDTMAKSTDIHSADFCWLLLLKQNKGFLMLAMFQDNTISLHCWIKEKLYLNPLSANPTKWSKTLKKVSLRVFRCFVGLALKGLKYNCSKKFDTLPIFILGKIFFIFTW